MTMVTGHHGTIQMIAHQRISRIVFSFATLCMLREQYVKMSDIYVCNQLHLLSVKSVYVSRLFVVVFTILKDACH